MAKVNCAISGLSFSVDYFSISISHMEGYFHPIFAVDSNGLYKLYEQYARNELRDEEEYLLFLAFLNYSNKVVWTSPASMNPKSIECKKLVANHIDKLVRVIEESNCIKHPSFKQPKFKVRFDNSGLESISNWIEAWQENIESFLKGKRDEIEYEDLKKVENKLSKYINSGKRTEEYTYIIAEWASRAAAFIELGKEKEEEYKRVIRSCFNVSKMFSTPLELIKEIKLYCENNIEVGSIHFHTLMKVLDEGMKGNIEYLGFELISLSDISDIGEQEEEKEPVKSDYSNSIDHLKAKLAYMKRKYNI